ncbi:helix-turn-helix domain-containing protein [Streptomyces sp. CB01580]|uniref:helix-turn-helix domain-containing protein n=1 Tax=Streptomyces sp. CB01580 TaxID=1703933 RepID=UPI00093EBAE3|nr:helix-turn-helix transcriptional regulator [Streptomyces sp. CB01580]OKJ42306.1 hypothetical protein AMK22_05195 [Streptomyces sp. CB01580]
MYDRRTLIAAVRSLGDEHYEVMGAKLGVSRSTAWRLWNGRVEPSTRTAAAVLRVYGVDLPQLIERTAA